MFWVSFFFEIFETFEFYFDFFFCRFLKELKHRSDVFLNESVNMIFSNIDQIYGFQQTFLNALRIAVDEHRIAECFLEHVSGFFLNLYFNKFVMIFDKFLFQISSGMQFNIFFFLLIFLKVVFQNSSFL